MLGPDFKSNMQVPAFENVNVTGHRENTRLDFTDTIDELVSWPENVK